MVHLGFVYLACRFTIHSKMKNLTLGVLALLSFQLSVVAQYSMTVESSPAVGAGGTVYRFYVNMSDPTDLNECGV